MRERSPVAVGGGATAAMVMMVGGRRDVTG